MKRIILFSHLIIGILVLFGCNSNKEKAKSIETGIPFYVGTYTGPESQGIYKYILQDNGQMKSIGLAAITPNPSYLTKSTDNKYLLAISEVSSKDKTGMVKSYSIENDSLVFISESTSGGAHPCFVSADKSGFVAVANYTGGNVALLKLDKEGQLSELLDLHQHTGSGITTRQRNPHAHSAWFDQGNNRIIAVDLGTNELWLYNLDKENNKIIPADPPTLKMNPGAGPRHLTFHPNGKWIYVVNELACTVSLVEKTANQGLSLHSSYSTLPVDFTEDNSCADIHISSDGKFVYASNRGHNSIAIFAVDNGSGELQAIGHESTRGETPRNFSLTPDNTFLLVANQNSNNIVSFNRNKETGLLKLNSEIEAPKPVCILF
ncbi:MAG: lactonase family protein [Bacteroidales bacterium]|jgi:6-phosphogluconolactonase|nr:lactonase family protein [Bacteroidales bacterium]